MRAALFVSRRRILHLPERISADLPVKIKFMKTNKEK
jgi:hypothetical protein